MGKSNHSKTGEGKNAWYRRRNLRRLQDNAGNTRKARLKNWLAEKAEREQQREQNPAAAETIPATSEPPRHFQKWLDKARNFMKFRKHG